MKKILIIAALLLPLWAVAQKTKKKEVLTTQQLAERYRFDELAARLQSDITLAKRRRLPTDLLEEQLAQARHLAVMMEATQRVVFIDSVVTSKDKMLNAIRIGKESGTLTTYSRAFGQADTLGCTVYQSQLGNQTIFAKPVDGYPMLHSGSSWHAAEPLAGLDEDDVCQNFPFMMQDGMTLYYGAVNPEGLGGYDIYFSRYDADEQMFREPENMGMPFNSPDNDYMLAIDELNYLGYLVTDRRQAHDSVCVYTFIPPTTHTNLCDLGIEGNELRQLAAITSIAATQTDAGTVAAARKRIKALSQQAEAATQQYDFTFVINDGTVYHHQSEFKNAKARSMVPTWQKLLQEATDSELQLDATRQLYTKATRERKNAMRQQLLTMETAYEQVLVRLHQQEKDIRRLECGQ